MWVVVIYATKITVKVLGMTVVKELSFESHLKTVCKKVSHEYALATASNNISQRKRTIIMTAFAIC